jgi:hypothetical protein
MDTMCIMVTMDTMDKEDQHWHYGFYKHYRQGPGGAGVVTRGLHANTILQGHTMSDGRLCTFV